MTDDSWQMAVGSWRMAVGSWRLAVGRWQMVVGRLGCQDLNDVDRFLSWIQLDCFFLFFTCDVVVVDVNEGGAGGDS